VKLAVDSSVFVKMHVDEDLHDAAKRVLDAASALFAPIFWCPKWPTWRGRRW
jgi:predicted nucleic acid-binding protein